VLEEFADLARSAGASVAATLTARIDRPNPATLIGSGKLEEVKAAAGGGFQAPGGQDDDGFDDTDRQPNF
jgi:hypothetical protein